MEPKKAASAYGFNYSMREGGLMMFGATVRTENSLEEARDILLRLPEEAAAGEFSAVEVERARTAMLKGIDLALRSPDRLGIRLSESMADGDWRLFFLQRDRLKAAALSALKAFHKDFYGASSGQFAAVGDFDPEAIKSLAGELFGGWASAKPFKRLEDKYKPAEPLNLSLEAPDKANANIILGLNFPMRDDAPDYPALQLADFMIGGRFLNSRLAVRIRQKEGLSYGVGCYPNFRSWAKAVVT